jgi:hypothetical protein
MSALSLDDAKAHLDITTSTNDAELQDFIDAAEGALGKRVGPLTPASISTRVEGYGWGLHLPVRPAISLTSVAVANSSTTLDLTTLYLDTNSGTVSMSDGSFFTSWAYDVAWQAGWQTVPPDLLHAVKEFVRHLWETQRGAPNRTIGSALVETIAPTLPVAAFTFPIRVEELLAPYEAIQYGLGA